MQTTSGRMPQNVVKYVATGTKYINVVLMLFHLGFALLFWKYEAWVLVGYQCISSFLLLFAYAMLHKKKKWTYILSIYLDILLFMILAVIYLGWEYGFQQYCISFVASFIFTDFYMSRDRKISSKTKMIVAVDVFLYVGLRLWTYEHPYVYYIDNRLLVIFFYLVNSLVGFSFLIMYLFFYSNTVHRLENSLIEMANVDALTGISNRRRMQDMLKTVLDEYENQRYQTVIAMLDIDHFKKINDTYGHDVGDEVLVRLAQILQNKHRENESFHVSRWGGEEFLVFYERHQKSREEVIDEFESLRQQVQAMEVEYNGSVIQITVTIGLAFYEKGESIHELIKVADQNLYEGKNSGRNKVVV